MIKITSLNKIYKSKKRKRGFALNDINLTLPDEGLVFVLGKSGSGKSTLLNLIGGLDNVTSGSIEVDGNDLAKFREKDFCNYRNTHIGFIFQDYHLIHELTVYENIVLSLNLRRIEDEDKVKAALEKVDLAGYEDRYPSELSGGEQQRVAIARAIVKKPRIILADEPTGNLDTATARAIIALLKELSRECLILIVSHNINDANDYADRIIELRKGKVISDMSRNPEFPEEIVLAGEELVYPDGTALSDGDIDLLNEHPSKKIVKRRDKFLLTNEEKKKICKVKIENSSLKFSKKLRLSGKFLKNKALAISLSSFMVAVIMVIMALAQTIITFDGSAIISQEMGKTNQSSLLLNKTVDDKTKARLEGNYRVRIEDGDIQAFYDAGYKGEIYPVYNISVPIWDYRNAAGVDIGYFHHGIYASETLGTLIVDEAFLTEKFGKLNYICKADEFHDSGIIITDYVADAILKSNQNYKGKSYQSLIGPYYFAHWQVTQTYINGIIETGYRERYGELFKRFENGELDRASDVYEDPSFQNFMEEFYGGLGFTYTFHEKLIEDYSDFEEFNGNTFRTKAWQERLVFNGTVEHIHATEPYTAYEPDLNDNEIVFSYVKYNEIFGTDYTESTLDTFVPHPLTISHYRFADADRKEPLFTAEVLVSGLYARPTRTMGVSENIYDLFMKDMFYANALYFDGTEGVGAVFDSADTLDYRVQSLAVEGVHTMTKAVDVFVPIFELIAVILCVGVVFILMNFSSKMIKDKMHEIGILKALGTKNNSIGVVFGLQVVLIALLTCVLSTVGYYFFIDIANDVLIESLKRLAPSQVVLDLDFLTFKPSVAMMNCALVFALALVSLIVPMIKIKTIKPVKIIKAKE